MCPDNLIFFWSCSLQWRWKFRSPHYVKARKGRGLPSQSRWNSCWRKAPCDRSFLRLCIYCLKFEIISRVRLRIYIQKVITLVLQTIQSPILTLPITGFQKRSRCKRFLSSIDAFHETLDFDFRGSSDRLFLIFFAIMSAPPTRNSGEWFLFRPTEITKSFSIFLGHSLHCSEADAHVCL